MPEQTNEWALYQPIIDRARAALRVPYVLLWQVDWPEDGGPGVRQAVCHAGLDQTAFLRFARTVHRFLPWFELLATRFTTHGSPLVRRVHVESISVTAPLRDFVGRELPPLAVELAGKLAGFRMMLMNPVVVEGVVVATLVSGGRRPFTEAQVALGEDFARQVALTWENRLMARRLAMLTEQAAAPALRVHGGIVLDAAARTARRDDAALSLTPLEFDLLAFLLANPGRPLSRDELAEHVWQYRAVTSNFVDVTVMNLRRKLEAGGAARLIHAVRGHGYVLR